MTQKLNVAFAGCGGIAQAHLLAIKEHADLVLHSVYDPVTAKAEAIATATGARMRASFDEILADAAVQAVYILTPNGMHPEQSIAAAKAGKHIFCEKPFAVSVADATRVVEAVDAAGVKLMVGYKMRHFPTIRSIREMLPAPLMVIGQVMDKPWPATHWATQPEHGGGSLVDQAGHVIDGVCFLAGARPVSVYAVGGNYYQANGVVDNCIATIRFENGVAGCVIMGDAWMPSRASKFSMAAYAKGMSIELYNRFADMAISREGAEPKVVPYQPKLNRDANGEAFIYENRLFLDCIWNDTPVPQDQHHGRHITEILAYAMQSCRDGKVYELSPVRHSR